MGRPLQTKPVRTGTSRRDFFKRSGATTVALAAASPLVGAVTAASPVFQHGVASGDPLSDRVILWTRVSLVSAKPTVLVNYVLATDPGLRNIVQRGTTSTGAQRDFTVKVDVAGLQPGTTYYYQFTAGGTSSPVGRTKTLPVGVVDRLRFAVVSCSNHAYGYFNAYGRIAQRADLDLVMHLGDYLYEYGTGQYGTARTPEPANEIISLADYRQRHAQYKRDVDSQAMHRQHPLVAIWDDHETANNSWKGGAENHQAATEGEWNARVDAALQAYYEWMPVRVTDPANLRDNHRGFAYGDLADLLMLEERLSARSEQLGTNIGSSSGYFTEQGDYLNAARTLLGTTQEAWLFNRLRTTPARWKFLGQGVMFAQLRVSPQLGSIYFNSDQWDGYQPARDRVYAAISGGNGVAPVDNVVVLTGDIHSSWAADLSPQPFNPDTSTGGYNPATGEGARAVEFVGTSVTSPGVDSDTSGSVAAGLKASNPHFKYVNLHRRGYMLVDVTRERAVGEWWFVDTVASASNIETFAVAFQTLAGNNRLSPAAQTTPRANPPLLAP